MTLLLTFGVVTPTLAKENLDPIQLSERGASIVGLTFVKSQIDSGIDTSWNYNTRIYRTTPIYDLNDDITGYTFYLKDDDTEKGYITVSSSSEHSLIKEFSDEGDPVYEKVFNEDTDKVINTGGLDYYVEKEGDVLTRVDGNIMDENDIIVLDKLDEERQTLNESILKEIFGEQYGQEYSITANTPGTAITNPVTYLQNVYGSGWTNHSYSNLMEGKLTGHLVGQTSTANDCVLVASSTILEYYKNYKGKTALGNYWGIYYTGVQVLSENPSYYSPSSGIGVAYISAYVKKVLAKYGYTWTVSSTYNMSLSSMKSQITNERPILVNIGTLNHYYYNHTVAAYAWTRFNGPSGGYVTFFKIYDGWSTSPRYVDVNSLGSLYTATKIVP